MIFTDMIFGDMLIKEVAKSISDRLSDCGSKSFYRLDGDEFAILGNAVPQERFIQRLQEMISVIAKTVFTIQEEEISVQVTVSLSFESDKYALFTSADLAMTSAKKNQQTLLIYDSSLLLNTECENNIKWTKKLQNAYPKRSHYPLLSADCR